MNGIPPGYAGNVLTIDLTNKLTKIIPLSQFWDMYDIDPMEYMGGDGFITKILWKDVPREIDPLGPKNEIIIATGPWTASAAPQSGRGMLGCISPETGGFSSGAFGALYAPALKYAGYDVVIIRGKAKKPSYIFIDNDEITIKSCPHLWGRDTSETVRMVRQELNEHYEGEIRVLSISIAGENLVRYATPCADAVSCPGRSGAGTVMGAKLLKAIAVRGSGGVRSHDPMGLLRESHRTINYLFENEPTIKLWMDHGASTAMSTTSGWLLNGDMLAKNRRNADTPHLYNVGCLNCMSPCYHWLQIKEGRYRGLRQLGGHMTFLTNSLRNLGIKDFDSWIYYERLIQELGMDTASFSAAFAWAVDCFQNDIIGPKDTDGLLLKYGDDRLIWEVANRVARREGRLGRLLADGVASASRKVGGNAVEMTSHVKGKPSIQKDSRIPALIWSLGALTSPRGGDWLRLHNVWELAFLPENRDTYPGFVGKTCMEVYKRSIELLDMPLKTKKAIFGDPPFLDVTWVKGTKGKACFSIWSENLVCLFNSLVTCMFGAGTQFLLVGFGPTTYGRILKRITGWDINPEELMKQGEKVFNLQRLLNYRLKGWTRSDDCFSDKKAYEPAPMGIYRGRKVPWQVVLDEYYKLRGWSREGLPTPEKLNELGIRERV